MTEVIDEVIYTTNGYLPLSQLNSDCNWEDESGFSVTPTLSPEGLLSFECVKEGHMVCVVSHYLKETGELVKQSRHIYVFKGHDLGLVQGNLI